jgi:sugar fermentation stimulation protein A
VADGGVALPPLVEATFIERPNRFLVIARIGRRRVRVASRDPGRLEQLLVPGARILVEPTADPSRRTRATLILVRRGPLWVSAVPSLANRVLEAALEQGGVPGLARTRVLAREVTRGRSRFDFLLSGRSGPVLTEVKSVALVEGRRALFPDAPTRRGVRHLRELTAAQAGGQTTSLVFIVQRPDADCVSPHRERDAEFAQALDAAARAGVRLRAFTCDVSPAGVRLARAIRVVL